MTGPNKERLRLWSEALRSGEYLQTKDILRTTPVPGDTTADKFAYCCLGVACEVAIKNGLTLDFDPYEHFQTLPGPVAEWFGITSEDGAVNHSEYTDENDDPVMEYNPSLASAEEVGKDPLTYPEGMWASALNDDEDWNFIQIADAVDRKWNLRDTDVKP